MNYFVDEKSIVRQIWRKSDTVLLIFAAVLSVNVVGDGLKTAMQRRRES